MRFIKLPTGTFFQSEKFNASAEINVLDEGIFVTFSNVYKSPRNIGFTFG